MEFERVYDLFKEISKVPRGSGNMEGISDFVLAFAKNCGCKAEKDEHCNVFAVKEAAPGFENEPPMILQAHMDMVCVKDTGVAHDFTKDPIEIVEKDGWITANGTSLGSDDGLGVSMMLALLESKDPMRKLEFIFTTDEETSMIGATGFDCSKLTGKYILNLDEEEEGHIVVSCAGSSDIRLQLSYEDLGYEHIKSDKLYSLTLSHFRGGHSGIEINENRLNALRVMGEILGEVKKLEGFKLASISGGQFFNAIPKDAEILFTVKDASSIENMLADKLETYKLIEPDAKLVLTEKPGEEICVYSDAATDRITAAIENAPHGVFTMHETIPGFVETSINFAIIRELDDCLEFDFMFRSNVDNLMDKGEEAVRKLSEKVGGSVITGHRSFGWEEKKDSAFVPYVCQKFEETLGKKPEVMGVHAGLECGVWSKKIPGADPVSMGPTLNHPHTTMEEASLESLEHYTRFVDAIVKGKI